MTEIIERYSKSEGKAIMPPLIAILFSHDKRYMKKSVTLQDLLPQEWLELQKREDGQGPFSSLSQDMLNYRMRVYNVFDPKMYERWII